MTEEARVFFRKVALTVILGELDVFKENKRRKLQVEKLKSLAIDGYCCPVCNLLIDVDKEEIQYCGTCGDGLPCETWAEEEHKHQEKHLCVICATYVCNSCCSLDKELCLSCKSIN